MLHLISLVFIFFSFSPLIVSCQQNQLVGEWTYEASERDQNIKLVYTFLKDKTYIQSSFFNGKSGRSSDGTYFREEDIVILKPRMSSQVIKGRLKGGKLNITMEDGGVYSPFQVFDVPLTKK